MESSGVHTKCEMRSLLVALTTPPGCGPRSRLTLTSKLVYCNKWIGRQGYFLPSLSHHAFSGYGSLHMSPPLLENPLPIIQSPAWRMIFLYRLASQSSLLWPLSPELTLLHSMTSICVGHALQDRVDPVCLLAHLPASFRYLCLSLPWAQLSSWHTEGECWMLNGWTFLHPCR